MSAGRWMRAALVAIALTSIVTVAACGGGGSGDPTATVKELVSLVEAKQFSKVADLACAAEKQSVAEQFDFGAQLSGALPGMDASAITDAMTISMEPISYTELEKSADKAKVKLTGTMTIAVDKDKMAGFVKQALEAQDMPVDDAQIGPLIDSMVSEFAQGEDIDSTVDLVYENGKWLICGVAQGD